MVSLRKLTFLTFNFMQEWRNTGELDNCFVLKTLYCDEHNLGSETLYRIYSLDSVTWKIVRVKICLLSIYNLVHDVLKIYHILMRTTFHATKKEIIVLHNVSDSWWIGSECQVQSEGKWQGFQWYTVKTGIPLNWRYVL